MFYCRKGEKEGGENYVCYCKSQASKAVNNGEVLRQRATGKSIVASVKA